MITTLATPDGAAASPASRLATPRAVLTVVILAKVVVSAVTAGRYGYHRDELYYIASSHHLALGYVDFNPATALVARFVSLFAGESVVALRLATLAAGVGVILITALIAKELGGGPRAQVVGGLAAAVCPWFLGANTLFQPVSFDQLTWSVCLYLIVRVLRRDEPRAWIALGIAVGVALWTKYTIVALLVSIAVGLLATPSRTRLRGKPPMLAAAIALAIAAPNIAWQATHGWATLTFLGQQNAAVRADYPPQRYLLEQILIVGPPAMLLAVTGLRRLWRASQLRPVAIAAVGVITWYLALGGKSYYPVTVYPVLFAAGAVAVEGSLRRWAIALAAFALMSAPFTIPILPIDGAIRAGVIDARDDWQDEIGWPDLTRTVAAVYNQLPADEQATAVVLGMNYGVTGAIDHYGPGLGLPEPYSGHNAYWWWRIPRGQAAPIIAVGVRDAAVQLDPYFLDCTQSAVIHNARGVKNFEAGKSVWTCDAPRKPWSELWPQLRHYG
jgi:hypothetical protein